MSRPRRIGISMYAKVALAAMALGWLGSARGAWVWVEGEKPYKTSMHRHPWWYDLVKRDQLSGGDLISNFDDKAAGEAIYRVSAPAEGEYEFWVRANPFKSRLKYKLNGNSWALIEVEKNQQGNINIAADDKPDMRYLAWTNVGKVRLRKGNNLVAFRMDSASSNHGYLDCFLFTTEAFAPNGAVRPDQAGAADQAIASANQGWFPFAPKLDKFAASSGIDLRGLNEKAAGDGGVIAVKDGRFVHSKTGAPVRFWAVNGPPGADKDALKREAKLLAKRGVNMVRVHHGYFDQKTGVLKMDEVKHALEVVEAMKAEGIYTHFSIYFPIWLAPEPGNPWLKGYDGKGQKPFAALYFNRDFQAHYRSWWKALLTTPSPTTGKMLKDEPAVAGLELVNEDSYFFWTFDAKNLPDAQIRILETQFGAWLVKRYGSIDGAFQKWNGMKVERDRPAEGRVSFRPLWNIANEKTPRDKDTARFLTESLREFYQGTADYLRRDLGFKGLITASNWVTASPEVLGPLEKYAYTTTDFIDRHGYFGCKNAGPSSEWSLQDGHTYVDRSALRFDSEEPGKAKQFVHPAMDTKYDDKPSMISETTWNRPNRYRTEAPLYYATYGALQGTDAVVHFALDGDQWSAKPGFFMQPWTLMSPSQVGQFPAAALIYRKGLVKEGDLLVDLNLTPESLFDLKGTPLPLDSAFDELRLKDVPKGLTFKPGNVIDPLVHFAGRTRVTFSAKERAPVVKDLKPYIDRAKQTVGSGNGEVSLDYGKGLLTLNAPAAQGVSGNLRDAGTAELKDISVTSGMELGHVMAVSLDDRPIETSRRILLQVMSEEKAADFKSQEQKDGVKKIVSIGHDPWLVKQFEGTVRLKRKDAASLKVTALDENGDAVKSAMGAGEIKLGPRVLYYLIEPGANAAASR